MSYGIYRNSEGYSDPTAGAAMSNILRNQNQQKKAVGKKPRSRERQRANRRLKRRMETLQNVMEKEESA